MLRPNFGDKLHAGDDEPRKNRLSKDLEGMYAKVMKKNKLSSAPSENTSPVPFRKVITEQQQRQSVFLSDPDIAHEINLPDALSKSMHISPGKNSVKSAQLSEDNNYETIDKRRARSSNSNYDSKNDPGYETIPADLKSASNKTNGNRNSSHVPTPSGNKTKSHKQNKQSQSPELSQSNNRFCSQTNQNVFLSFLNLLSLSLSNAFCPPSQTKISIQKSSCTYSRVCSQSGQNLK